jgi:parvulin-like peptidyl-prolyl isomerase
MSKFVYIVAALILFGLGAYVWKIKNTGIITPVDSAEVAERPGVPSTAVVVEVGREKLTQADIEWEYAMLTEGVMDKDSLTPIPNLGKRYDEEMQTLRKSLVSSMIERKLLYQFLQQDKEFTFEEPGRYTGCLTQWQTLVKEDPDRFSAKDAKDRIKARLCELSIIDQYMRERLFPSVVITEAEIVEYFKNHRTEFQRPERVEIRQVLLGSESEANKTRNQINANNFAEIAKERSIAPEAEDGGKLGPFAQGAMPSVFEAAFHLRKGEISGVLKSPYGYHIILVTAKHPKEELSLDQARPKVKEIIRKRREGEVYQKWVETALAAISVSNPKPLW